MRIFKPVPWVHHTNIYEVNLRQYTSQGTFEAFIPHLPRLKEMGVHTLWFMPLTPISEKNKKGVLGSYYACSDYTAINKEFGTLEEFKALVKLAQKIGFKIIIDWVANHTGWDHVWTKEQPGYYLRNAEGNDFKMANGMEDIIELNYDNPALRHAMIEAMKWWIEETNIDGFRCDLAFWVRLDFWREARKILDSYKPMLWLGEFDELERPEYGEVFDLSYSWTWMHKTENFFKNNEQLSNLISILKKYDDLGDGTIRAWFTSNHDENSWNGTEYEKYGEMAKALAVFSCTWNGLPLIYSGQEIPNTKRLKFFEKDELEWKHFNELHDFYRTLLLLKTSNPALRAGDPSVMTYQLKTNHPSNVLAYLRSKDSNEVLIVLNLSNQPLDIEIVDDKVKGEFVSVFDLSALPERLEAKAWDYFVFIASR
jgi:glycosidase